MKKALTAVLAAAAVVTFAGVAMAAGMAKSGSLERVVTIKSVGASATESEKFYWEGDRLRSEKYSVNGMVVQIKDGRTIYLFSPERKEAMKATLPEKAAQSVQQMLAAEAGSVKGGKKVGRAQLSGFNCDVYVLSKTVGGITSRAKIYLSTDPRLPIPMKMEVTMGKTVQTVETRNVKLNSNISDSMFTLPKGTKVKEQKIAPAPAPGAPKGKK